MKITLRDIDDPTWAHHSPFVISVGTYWLVQLYYDQRNIGTLAVVLKPTILLSEASMELVEAERVQLLHDYRCPIQVLWHPDSFEEKKLDAEESLVVQQTHVLMPNYTNPGFSERVFCGIVFLGQPIRLNVNLITQFRSAILAAMPT